MIQNEPVLTICIPTFNNNSGVANQLKKLLPQLEHLNVLVKIIDNCNYISTRDFLIHEGIDISNLIIVRHDSNIGGDKNIEYCYFNCTTKWLWILSDNDPVLNDCLDNILNLIFQNQDCIAINLGNKNQIKAYNLLDFCKNLNYGMSFSISYNLINLGKFHLDSDFYRKFVNFSQAPAAVLLFNQFSNYCNYLFSDYNPFLSSDQPNWSKKQFTLLTLMCEKEYSNIFKNYSCYNLYVKKSIFDMNFWNINFGRVYQDISFIDYILLTLQNLKLLGFYNSLNWIKVNFSNLYTILFKPNSKYVKDKMLGGEVYHYKKVANFY
jgi:hypothetical protein